MVNGEALDWKEVGSRVPQGSVLGLLMFVIFINDLSEVIRQGSVIYLCVDDMKISRRFSGTEDCARLQEGLTELQKWSKRWMSEFHPDKNRYMRVGRSSAEEQSYTMCNTIMKTIGEKDIGVVLDDRRSFLDHMAEKINKANKIVGLIRRTFLHLDSKIFKAIYRAIVRPIIKHANQVWCPHLMKDLDAQENVQCLAIKMVPELKDLPYEK